MVARVDAFFVLARLAAETRCLLYYSMGLPVGLAPAGPRQAIGTVPLPRGHLYHVVRRSVNTGSP
jgi:hypothetical protein